MGTLLSTETTHRQTIGPSGLWDYDGDSNELHHSASWTINKRPFIEAPTMVAVWLRSGNALVSINVAALRRARLVLGWVTAFAGIPSRCLTKPPRPTQPGHPSVGRRNEYWRWSWSCEIFFFFYNRDLDSRSRDSGFDSWPFHFHVMAWTSCSHTHVSLSPSSIIWYQPKCSDALRQGVSLVVRHRLNVKAIPWV